MKIKKKSVLNINKSFIYQHVYEFDRRLYPNFLIFFFYFTFLAILNENHNAMFCDVKCTKYSEKSFIVIHGSKSSTLISYFLSGGKGKRASKTLYFTLDDHKPMQYYIITHL